MAGEIVVSLVFVGGIWALICNEVTHKQRVRLIDARPRGCQYWACSAEWERVSYDQHLLRLLTFRNPRHLYGPLTQQIWQGRP